MINVKEAAHQALSYFEELYDEEAFENILLEEVERAEEADATYWYITIGFTDKKVNVKESGPSFGLGPSPEVPPRRYKRFKIDAETGEVVSMKIRSVENA